MSEKQPSQPKRRWSQFRLRTLLILITLASFVFGIYKPITLHFQAKRLFNIDRPLRSAGRQNPRELFFNTFGWEDTALFQIGQVKIALLERRQDVGISTAGFIPIAGEAHQQKTYQSPNGDEYFLIRMRMNKWSALPLIFHFDAVQKLFKLTTSHSISPLPPSFLSTPMTKFYTPTLARNENCFFPLS